MKSLRMLFVTVLCYLIFAPLLTAQEKKVQVVCTLPTLKALTEELGGSRVNVIALARGDQDPHFVTPTPVLMQKTRQADLLIQVGFSLELWADQVANGSGNPRIFRGTPGRVIASNGISALEVPSVVSREFGDTHPQGNPHVWLDPLLAKVQAANITEALRSVDPGGAAYYESRKTDFFKRVDDALFGHISFALGNAARSLVFGLTNGRGIPAPPGGVTRRYYQQMTRFSAAFALSADVAMAVLGGSLKRHEKISGRLGDVLSMLYLCSATLKRFEDDGRPAEDLPLLHWAMQDALYKIQQAFSGVIQNFPNSLVRGLLCGLIFPLGKHLSPPSDHLGHEIATLLMQPGAARDRLTAGMYLSRDEQDALGALESALSSTLACEPLQAKLEEARKAGKLKAMDELARIAEARDAGIISAEQSLQLQRDYALRRKVIMVDDFAPAELAAGK